MSGECRAAKVWFDLGFHAVGDEIVVQIAGPESHRFGDLLRTDEVVDTGPVQSLIARGLCKHEGGRRIRLLA